MNDEEVHVLDVQGSLPPGLSGQYLRIGPEQFAPTESPVIPPRTAVEVISIRTGQAVSYRRSRVPSGGPADEPAAGGEATAIVDFGGRRLVFGAATVASDLAPDLRSLRPLDLAGRGQPIGGHPTLDPRSGELHLLAAPQTWSSAHQVISPGAMTRHTRPLTDSPSPIHHLAVTTDRLVLFADGATGITSRNPTETDRIQWFSTRTFAARDVLATHDQDTSVVVLIAGRGLQRWTLEPTRGTTRCDLIDARTHRFGCINAELTTSPVRYLFTVGGVHPTLGTQLYKHDLLHGHTTSRDFGLHRHADEFVFVRDPQRAGREDGGWLVGLVHDEQARRASFVVVDAADLEVAPVATIALPGPTPYPRCGSWFASPPR